MFRLWGKLFKNGRLMKDMVVENNDHLMTRTSKVFHSIEEICYEFDLSKPIWLESSIREFKTHDKVRFTQDNFVDFIDYDYLEIQVIEE